MKIPQVFTLIPHSFKCCAAVYTMVYTNRSFGTILGLIPRVCKNKKASITVRLPMPYSVGMTRFELATTHPPDAYSTGLSYIPNCGCKSTALFLKSK